MIHLGDFSGWKPIPLVNTDPYLAKNFHIQDLSVGKYRYLYIVDGVECIDETATVIEEKGDRYNHIVILNALSKTKDIPMKGMQCIFADLITHVSRRLFIDIRVCLYVYMFMFICIFIYRS